MPQMVASGRGFTALPKWLVTDDTPQLKLHTLGPWTEGVQQHLQVSRHLRQGSLKPAALPLPNKQKQL